LVSVSDTCPCCKNPVTLSTMEIFICPKCGTKLDIYIGNGYIEGIDWVHRTKYTRLSATWKLRFLDSF
jgi:predicted amidophosphoribosyltransferase